MRLFAICFVLFTVGVFAVTGDPARSMVVATICAALSWVGSKIDRALH